MPTSYADHHVLVQDLGPNGNRPHPVVRTLSLMTGFNIDGSSNVIALPSTRAGALATGRAAHPGRHLGAYFEIQEDFLAAVLQAGLTNISLVKIGELDA